MCAPNHSHAAGLLKSTIPMPGCQRSVCQTEPSAAFDQVAMIRGFCKESRALRDVGVDPYADLQSAVVEAPQHSGRIGKYERIPLEVYPLKFAHPKAVEVKNVQWQVASLHLIDKASDGCLIVVRRKRCREPQTERPRRRQCRAFR